MILIIYSRKSYKVKSVISVIKIPSQINLCAHLILLYFISWSWLFLDLVGLVVARKTFV